MVLHRCLSTSQALAYLQSLPRVFRRSVRYFALPFVPLVTFLRDVFLTPYEATFGSGPRGYIKIKREWGGNRSVTTGQEVVLREKASRKCKVTECIVQATLRF